MKSEAKECTCQQIPHLSPCITPMSTHRVVLAFSGAVMLLYVLCSNLLLHIQSPPAPGGLGTRRDVAGGHYSLSHVLEQLEPCESTGKYNTREPYTYAGASLSLCVWISLSVRAFAK